MRVGGWLWVWVGVGVVVFIFRAAVVVAWLISCQVAIIDINQSKLTCMRIATEGALSYKL